MKCKFVYVDMEFFVGHLIGHKSIVHMLQKKNFIVERLSVHEKIPGYATDL